MTFREWCDEHRVKAKQDGEELTAHGKYGYISEGRTGSEAFVAAILATPRNRLMNAALNSRKQQAEAGGLTPLQMTPHVFESMWTFDGSNPAHSELTIELIRPKRRKQGRVLTDEQRAVLVSQLAVARAARGGAPIPLAQPA